KKADRGRTVLGNARAFMEEGKMESARHALSKILEADPENDEALEMMREIKSKGGSAAVSESRPAPMPRPSAPSRKLPVIPMAAGGVVLLLVGAGAYFFMHAKSDTSALPAPKIAKIQKKNTPTPVAAAPVAAIPPDVAAAAQHTAEEA